MPDQTPPPELPQVLGKPSDQHVPPVQPYEGVPNILPTRVGRDGDAAVECKHKGVEGTAWLSPWWIENTDWEPVSTKK